MAAATGPERFRLVNWRDPLEVFEIPWEKATGVTLTELLFNRKPEYTNKLAVFSSPDCKQLLNPHAFCQDVAGACAVFSCSSYEYQGIPRSGFTFILGP